MGADRLAADRVRGRGNRPPRTRHGSPEPLSRLGSHRRHLLRRVDLRVLRIPLSLRRRGGGRAVAAAVAGAAFAPAQGTRRGGGLAAATGGPGDSLDTGRRPLLRLQLFLALLPARPLRGPGLLRHRCAGALRRLLRRHAQHQPVGKRQRALFRRSLDGPVRGHGLPGQRLLRLGRGFRAGPVDRRLLVASDRAHGHRRGRRHGQPGEPGGHPVHLPLRPARTGAGAPARGGRHRAVPRPHRRERRPGRIRLSARVHGTGRAAPLVFGLWTALGRALPAGHARGD